MWEWKKKWFYQIRIHANFKRTFLSRTVLQPRARHEYHASIFFVRPIKFVVFFYLLSSNSAFSFSSFVSTAIACLNPRRDCLPHLRSQRVSRNLDPRSICTNWYFQRILWGQTERDRPFSVRYASLDASLPRTYLQPAHILQSQTVFHFKSRIWSQISKFLGDQIDITKWNPTEGQFSRPLIDITTFSSYGQFLWRLTCGNTLLLIEDIIRPPTHPCAHKFYNQE